jgi:hypothetical protein
MIYNTMQPSQQGLLGLHVASTLSKSSAFILNKIVVARACLYHVFCRIVSQQKNDRLVFVDVEHISEKSVCWQQTTLFGNGGGL